MTDDELMSEAKRVIEDRYGPVILVDQSHLHPVMRFSIVTAHPERNTYFGVGETPLEAWCEAAASLDARFRFPGPPSLAKVEHWKYLARCFAPGMPPLEMIEERFGNGVGPIGQSD